MPCLLACILRSCGGFEFCASIQAAWGTAWQLDSCDRHLYLAACLHVSLSPYRWHPSLSHLNNITIYYPILYRYTLLICCSIYRHVSYFTSLTLCLPAFPCLISLSLCHCGCLSFSCVSPSLLPPFIPVFAYCLSFLLESAFISLPFFLCLFCKLVNRSFLHLSSSVCLHVGCPSSCCLFPFSILISVSTFSCPSFCSFFPFSILISVHCLFVFPLRVSFFPPSLSYLLVLPIVCLGIFFPPLSLILSVSVVFHFSGSIAISFSPCLCLFSVLPVDVSFHLPSLFLSVSACYLSFHKMPFPSSLSVSFMTVINLKMKFAHMLYRGGGHEREISNAGR